MPTERRSVDPEAPAQILAEHHRRFLAFVQRRVATRDEAEDVLQSAFVKALPKLHTLRRGERVTAWFYRVLRNAILDRGRATTRERRQLTRLAETDDLAADPVVAREVCACLEGVVATLKPAHAELLRRIDLAEEATATVAHSLGGVTPGTLRVRLHRARSALRQAIVRTCRTCATHGCLDCTCAQDHEGGPRRGSAGIRGQAVTPRAPRRPRRHEDHPGASRR